jgi:hypothetical protein
MRDRTHLLVNSHVGRSTEDLANGVMFCSRQGDYSDRRCSNSKKFQGRAHGRRAKRYEPPENRVCAEVC